MVKIPDGSFKMGDNKVSMKSFYMGKYELLLNMISLLKLLVERNLMIEAGGVVIVQ